MMARTVPRVVMTYTVPSAPITTLPTVTPTSHVHSTDAALVIRLTCPSLDPMITLPSVHTPTPQVEAYMGSDVIENSVPSVFSDAACNTPPVSTKDRIPLAAIAIVPPGMAGYDMDNAVTMRPSVNRIVYAADPHRTTTLVPTIRGLTVIGCVHTEYPVAFTLPLTTLMYPLLSPTYTVPLLSTVGEQEMV